MLLNTTLILRLILPVLLLVLLWGAHRRGWSRTLQMGCLLFLSLLSLYAHTTWLHLDERRSSVHNREFYHYFIGSKYFAELGYYHQYNATVLADYEDDRARFLPHLLVRELTDHTKIITRGDVVKRYAQVKQRFSAARWAAFKRDIGWFRSKYLDGWRHTNFFHDHGYNGSPVLHVLLGGIANTLPMSMGNAFRLLSYADVVMLLLVVAFLWWSLGPFTALLFLFFFGINPFNDSAFIGGAYMRYLDLFAIAICLACWRRGWLVWGGVWASFAISIRVFEVVWLLPLFVLFVFRWRDQALRQASWRFVQGLALAGVLLLAITSVMVPRTSWNPWADFAKRLSILSAKDSLNTISLNNVFHYSDKVKRHNFLSETKRNLQENIWTIRLFKALCCLLLLLFCFKCAPFEAFFAGIFLVFLFFPLSHYYYYVLCLVPLMFREYRFWAFLALMCFVCALIRAIEGTSFLSFTLQSYALIGYLLGVTLLRLANEPVEGQALAQELEATLIG